MSRQAVWYVLFVAVAMLGCTVARAGGDTRLRVSHAEARPWAGGVAGQAGTAYGITLVSRHPRTAVRIAGVWVGGEYVAFEGGGGGGRRGNVSVTEHGDVTEYRINCNVERSGGAFPALRRDEGLGATSAPAKPRPTVIGEAVVDVYVDGKERYVAVEKFEMLPSANFP